jgi:hypothetical protein
MISGVVLSVEVEQLKLKTPGVCDDHRLVRRRPGGERGETVESLSVLLSFESLPDMLGYISYPVRVFVLNPLSCFRCNVYGHVVAV